MFAHALGITNLWTYALGAAFIIVLPGPNSMYVLAVAARRGVRHGYRAACGVFLGDTILIALTAAGAASLLRASPVLFSAVKYLGAGYLLYLGANMLRGAVKRVRPHAGRDTLSGDSLRAAKGVRSRVDMQNAMQDAMQDVVQNAAQDAVQDTAQSAVQDATQDAVQDTAQGAVQDATQGAVQDTAQDRAGSAAHAIDGKDEAHPFGKSLAISLLNPKAILFLLSFFVQFVDPAYAHHALSFFALGAILQFFSLIYLSTLIFSGARLAGQFRRFRRVSAGAMGVVGALFIGFSVKLALVAVAATG